MPADTPTQVPARLRAGDTWQWTRTLADYPAPDWTLKYRLKGAMGGLEIVTTASGTDHAANVSASASAGTVAGDYAWVAWVESGSDKFTVESGVVTIDPDYRATAAGKPFDDRTHAARMLAAINAWLESRDPGVAEYEIAGRKMKYTPLAELVKLRQRYITEVASEQAAAAVARGEPISGRKIQFRI